MKPISKEQVEETALLVDQGKIHLDTDTHNRVLVNGNLYPLAYLLAETYKRVYGEVIPLPLTIDRKNYMEDIGFKAVRTTTSFYFLAAEGVDKYPYEGFITDGNWKNSTVVKYLDEIKSILPTDEVFLVRPVVSNVLISGKRDLELIAYGVVQFNPMNGNELMISWEKVGNVNCLFSCNIGDNYFYEIKGKELKEFITFLNTFIPEIKVGNANQSFMRKKPLNQILFGPPGTGKTYHTINKAIEIADPDFYAENATNRVALHERFDQLMIRDWDNDQGQIAFCTFHQSMSYEDFVEGIKPQKPDEDKPLSYEVEDGIFKRMCNRSSRNESQPELSKSLLTDGEFNDASFFKLSLGDRFRQDIYNYCLDHDVIAIGYGEGIDFSAAKQPADIIQLYKDNGVEVKNRQDGPVAAIERFVLWPKKGDIYIVSNGNKRIRAICMDQGEYFCDPDSKIGFEQFRRVKWLLKDIDLPVSAIYGSNFMMSAIYQVYKERINKDFFVSGQLNFKSQWDSYLKEIGSKGRTIHSLTQNKKYQLGVPEKGNLTLTTESGTQYQIDKDLISKAFQLNEGTPVERVKSLLVKEPTHFSWPSAVLSDFEAFVHKPGKKDFVLIIDEINRGNVSQIFGELITLIEEDKRAGKSEALEVTLPYSKEPFSVPSNLYIIGTMNTADRSVEALDTALRRRFVFEEKGPESHLLSPNRMFWKLLWDNSHVKWKEEPYFSLENSMYKLFGTGARDWEERYAVWDDYMEKFDPDFERQGPLLNGFFDPNGLNLEKLLNTINARIELLLSKDHQIGHSYFLNVYSEEALKVAFYKSIIPLLQEYFYGDYGKIGLVLGPRFVAAKKEKTVLIQFDKSYDFEDLQNRVVYEILDYKDSKPGEFLEAVRSIYQSPKSHGKGVSTENSTDSSAESEESISN